jgi:hypothetical protein
LFSTRTRPLATTGILVGVSRVLGLDKPTLMPCFGIKKLVIRFA